MDWKNNLIKVVKKNIGASDWYIIERKQRQMESDLF